MGWYKIEGVVIFIFEVVKSSEVGNCYYGIVVIFNGFFIIMIDIFIKFVVFNTFCDYICILFFMF